MATCSAVTTTSRVGTPQDRVGLEGGDREKLGDQLGRGRHDRQTVGPPAGVVVVEELGVVAVFVTRRLERAHVAILAALRRSTVVRTRCGRFSTSVDDAVDEGDVAGADRGHTGARHHHADQVERVGGVERDPLTGTGLLAGLVELLVVAGMRTARR